MSRSSRSILALLFFLAVTFGVAAIGAQFGPGEWYASLQKPSWNPPSWVFAPVWTALYLMMAIAAWMVWRTEDPRRRIALALYLTQLLLNGLWSWIFFGLKSPGMAFADIVLLWVAIAITLEAFRRIRPVSAALLVPYLAWVSFASALNFAIWRANG